MTEVKKGGNVEACNNYIINDIPEFNFEVNEKSDTVILTEYHPSSKDYDEIRIPDFVTGVCGTPFSKVKVDSVRVIWDNCKCSNFSYMFESIKCKNLVIDIECSKVKNIRGICRGTGCHRIEFSDRFVTTDCEDMGAAFACNPYLKELILGNSFHTSKVTNMMYMFSAIPKIKYLNLGLHFKFDSIQSCSLMFFGTDELKTICIDDRIPKDATRGKHPNYRCRNAMKVFRCNE